MIAPGPRVATVSLRYFFAALLLAAGAGKAADIVGFIPVVAGYGILPAAAVAPAAVLLTLVELFLGAWLASGRRLATAAVVVVGLHMMYLVWLAQALLRGLEIPNCGCFGVYWPRPLTWWTLVEDTLLLGLAGLLRHGAGRYAGKA